MPQTGNSGRSTADIEVELKVNGVAERTEASECVDRHGDIGEVLIDGNSMDKSTAEKSSLLSIADDSISSSVESFTNADSMEMDVVDKEGEKSVNHEPFSDMVDKEGVEKKVERISTRPQRKASSTVKAKSLHQVSVESI